MKSFQEAILLKKSWTLCEHFSFVMIEHYIFSINRGGSLSDTYLTNSMQQQSMERIFNTKFKNVSICAFGYEGS